jgi:hypothetical protein
MSSVSTSTGCGPQCSTTRDPDEDDSPMLRRPVKRDRSGRYQLRLSAPERDLLRTLPDQLKALLKEGDDPGLRRFFPPAYVEDREGEAEYRRLVGDDLVEGRMAALDVMSATIDATELDEQQITAWLSAVNDFRLFLGTQLDVSEEEMPIDTPLHQLYYYLTGLEDGIISALASQYD